MPKVIGKTALFGLIVTLAAAMVNGQALLRAKVDSMFVIASSREVKFRGLVQPAIDSVAAIGVVAVPVLIDKLDTKSARERVALVNIFKKIGPSAVPLLVNALGFNNSLVVERVCNVLGEIADSNAVTGLSATAVHPKWRVREEAIGSLGKIRSSRANGVVQSALDDSIGQVRKSAVVSSGQMKITSALPKLVSMLGDSFYGARLCAIGALKQFDTAQVVSLLADSLVSDNYLVGNLSCKLLGELATPKAIELLLLQTCSPDRSRRAQASVALVNADPNDKTGFQAKYRSLETDPLVLIQIESAIARRHGH